MKIKCWQCGATIDVMEAAKDQCTRDIIKRYTEFGRHSKLVSEYMDCFKTENGLLRPKRHLRLLKGLLDVYQQEGFSFNRRKYSISKTGLITGVITVVDRIPHGLTNHNYLYRVLIKISDQEDSASERKREKDRFMGYRDNDSVMSDDATPAEIKKAFGGFIKNFGSVPEPAAPEPELPEPVTPKREGE